MFTPEEIQSFRELYAQETGREIDEVTAKRLARRLLALVRFSLPRKTEKDSDRGP